MAKEMFDKSNLNAGATDELNKLPDGEPFAVINLLRYKDRAEYPPGKMTEKLTGRQAYERYSQLSVPFVNKAGGVPLWRGNLAINLIGPKDESWDEVLIMQYPNRVAFQRMMTDPNYLAIVFHRDAGVLDSRLYGVTSLQSIGPMKWKLFNLSRKLRGH